MADWIKKAVKHPGAFSEKAKKAGKSVRQYALEKQHDSGVLGKQARLALTLEGMHGGGHSSPKKPGDGAMHKKFYQLG